MAAIALPLTRDSFSPTPRLSAQRIAAYTSAMSLHAVVFAVLLMPVAIPYVQDALPKRPPETITEATLIPLPLPLPAVPDIPVPPEVERQPPPPKPEIRAEQAPVFEQVAIAEPATVPLPDVTPTETGPVAPARGGPMEMNTLAYIAAPPPKYPAAATRKGWEGVVLLRVLVDEDGYAEQVSIERSSGRSLLDVTAAKQVRRWRFRAALRDGVAVKAWATVPVEFRLNRR